MTRSKPPLTRDFEKLTWTPAMDAALMDSIADGVSITKTGEAMGITKGSAIGRFQRLKIAMGWQAD